MAWIFLSVISFPIFGSKIFLNSSMIFSNFTSFNSPSGGTISFPSGSILSYNGSFGTAIVNGVTMIFFGYSASIFTGSSLNVSQIIVQPNDGASANQPVSISSTASQVDSNLQQTIAALEEEYNKVLDKLTITPYCITP